LLLIARIAACVDLINEYRVTGWHYPLGLSPAWYLLQTDTAS